MLARLAWPFWNAEERRLRALLRVAIHGALLAIVLFVVAEVGALLSAIFRDTPAAPLFEPFSLLYWANVVGVVVVTWGCALALDRRPFGDLGLRWRRDYLLDVIVGVAIGGACMGAIAVLELALGLASYAPRLASPESVVAVLPPLGSSLTVFVGVAILEELVSRGYHLTNLAEGLARPGSERHPIATLGAVAISSIAFGLGHAPNPSATWASVAFIALGGVFLAIGFVTQGDLALPIGAHLGWNFFQNALAMPVSGLTDLHGGALVARTEIGDDLWSGGPFGPEAGLTGLAGMALGIGLSLAWVRVRTGTLRIAPGLGISPRAPETVPDVAGRA